MNIRDIDNRISRMLAGVRQVFRGVIGGVDSSGPVQLVQGVGLAGETLSDLEYFQHYGYTSNPPGGAMKVIAPIGGKTSHGIVIATEHGTYRLQGLESGEVALYTDEGDSVVMRRGRVIDVTTQTLNIKASTAVNIDTPIVNVKHQLTVQEQITGQGGLSMTGGSGAHIDKLTVDGDAQIGGKSFLEHEHPGDSGGTTGVPI